MQSIGNCVDRLQNILKDWNDCKFLCITEHWKSDQELVQISIKNFKLISKVCRAKGKHGGAAVYTQMNVTSKCRTELQGLSVIGDIECAVAECHVDTLKFIIASVYRPCNGDFGVFFERLEQLLSFVANENKIIIFSGDFNIEMGDVNKNRKKGIG